MKRLILVVLFATRLISTASADFSEVFVFGDSLSDVGNISTVTLGIQPGSDYFDGRFSNGPVYSELLASELGLGPLTKSLSGGNNFAFGGGRTSGTSVFEGGFLIQDLDDQVDNFLENRTVDPNALFIVFAGSNDFVLGNQTNPSIPARRIGSEFDRLIDAGAKSFLSISLPLLGQTPRFAATVETMNERSREFNRLLGEELDQLTLEHTDISMFRFDLAELFEQLIAIPTPYGFSDVTSVGMEADDSDGFLFWDDVHPTTQAHSLLAKAAADLLQPGIPLGDFNYNDGIDIGDVDILGHSIVNDAKSSKFDLDNSQSLNSQDLEKLLVFAGTFNGDLDLNGDVDFPDFITFARNFGESGESVLWSSGDLDLNGEVDFPDFVLLARNFGEPRVSSFPVPEPASSFALAAMVLASVLRYERFNRCQSVASRSRFS